MSNYPIQKMKETRTLVLTKGQLFWHFCIIIVFLIPPFMATVDVFKYYVTNTYQGVRTLEEMVKWSYIPLIPAIGFYYIQKKRLKFKIIDIAVDSNTFISAAKDAAQQMDWEILKQKKDLIVAKSGFTWRSWGELITIINDDNCVFFNSICDPDSRPSISSWGMNKKNLKSFENILLIHNYTSHSNS